MTFLDLFAGIGGFRRGLELAGHRCIGFCEWDKYAAASYTSMYLLTDEQREELAALPLKQRQKEILKEEYRNGEWYASDIRDVRAEKMPKADCWTFGAPCQDFSVAGTRSGMAGERSSLVREVFRLLRETEEGDRPEWLIYENVKGILSSNSGLDYLSVLLEMEELGYDVQWQIFNSKDWGVPQNRERVYTVGHLRAKGGSQVFPFPGADGANQSEAEPILMNERSVPLPGGCKVPSIQNRVYDADGISCTVTASPRFQPSYAVPCFIDKRDDVIHERKVANAITATEDRGLSQRNQVGTAILLPIGVDGRKTTKESHPGIFVQIEEDLLVYAIWYEKYRCYIVIRKLTPRECFRLQGWEDPYFDRAAMVNTDSQLYKQAGNGVTVPVVYAIGCAIRDIMNNDAIGVGKD